MKVIDSSCFPTNKYKSKIDAGNIEEIPKWSLLIEYFKVNLECPIVRRGTKKTLLADQVHNLNFLLKLFMNVYMIDYVLSPNKREDSLIFAKDRHVELLLICSFMLLPFVIEHIIDYRRISWKVGGSSRKTIQKSLLRKFLNYDEESRENVNGSDVIMAMTRDAVDLVHLGYVNVFSLASSVGQLLVVFLFQVSAPHIFNKKARPIAFAPLIIFPLVLIPFLIWRRPKTNAFESDRNQKQDELVSRVNRTVDNYHLIADFNQRPLFVSWFEEVIKTYNSANTAASQVMKNNEYFSPWLTLIFACVYTRIGGGQVIDWKSGSPMSLGIFLTNLNIIYAIGNAYGSIYKTLLTMQSTFDSLERIVRLMNLTTDLNVRKKVNRCRREMTNQIRAEIRAKHESSGVQAIALDLLPIKLEDVQFSYPRGSSRLNLSGKVEIQQGSLVALVGPRGQGKTTLLKILGGELLPNGGTCFVPSHLRVLHVSTEVYFVQGTLYKNLVFGVKQDDKDGELARVHKVCSDLGLDSDIHTYIDSNQVLPWKQILTHTQKYLVSFARALIANPEILCIHKPTLALDEKRSVALMSVLKEFVTSKGLDQDPATLHLRRPRTCIMTSAKFLGVETSDAVVHVCAETGIEVMKLEDVSAEMLA